MKKFLTVLMCTAILSAPLYSCKHGETVNESSGISQVDEDNNFKEDSTYCTGTFNDEVFQQVCHGIHIKDIDIVVPCTLKDLGKHFSLNFMLYDTENELVTYELKYDDEFVGYVLFDGVEELDEKQVETQTFYSISLSGKHIQDITICGIQINDPIKNVNEVFGEPDSEVEFDGVGHCKYKLKDRQYIDIVYHYGVIDSIQIVAYD